MSGITDLIGEDTASVPDDPFAGEQDEQQEFGFTAKRYILAALASRAGSVVPSRDILPILRCFRVQAGDGMLSFTASDLELTITAGTQAVSCTGAGTAYIPARRLSDLLKEADDGDVSVAVSGRDATVTCGSANWSLKLARGDDWPEAVTADEAEMHDVPCKAFLDALSLARYAAGRDGGRPNMMQADISPGSDGLRRITASDGSRFQQVQLRSFPLDMQIPVAAVDELVKLLRDCEAELIQAGATEHALVFRAGDDTLTAGKLMAKFPDIQKLLLRPALENKHVLQVSRAELIGAIRKARIAADEETSAIALLLEKGSLTVVARDKFGNTADCQIAAGWDGGERQVVINHQFLTQLLDAYQAADVTLRLGDDKAKKKAPVLLDDPEAGFTGVIQVMIDNLVGY
jgi:DNA polymerase III subunit beta